MDRKSVQYSGKMPTTSGNLPMESMVATIDFKPTGSADPRHGEFLLLAQLLNARVRNDADLAALAIERIDVDVISRFVAQGLKSDELAFIIPRRALTHRRQHHERLSIDESDRAIRLARLLAQATTTFGNAEKATLWLRNPQQRFSGKTALDLVSTEHGARLVEEALIQIDEGYFA
jgi:putative toxin-antitoxin system antitoxin component (TIGR02293 family)